MKALYHSYPKLTLMFITKISSHLSVMVNPPMCTSSLTEMTFLMPKYFIIVIHEFSNLTPPKQKNKTKDSKVQYNFFHSDGNAMLICLLALLKRKIFFV